MKVWLLVAAACHAEAAAPVESQTSPPPPKPAPQHTGGRRVVTDTEVHILDQVQFQGTQIVPASYPTLDAVAATLNGNPEITLLEVDDFAPNQAVADARARAYASYLVGKGVSPNRLRPVGNVDTNERVQLLILQRKP